MTKTQTAQSVDIAIRRHPRLPLTHARVIVTVRGQCWCADWADEGEGVSEERALAAWREDRRSFSPYIS